MGHAGTGRRGSIRQSANGSWFFVVDITQPGGERRQTRRRGYATRRDAQRELTRVLTSVDDRAYVEPKRQTLAVFLTETWLPAVEHTIKPSTFESYRRNVRLHMSGRAIGRRRLQQLGPADLNALYALLIDGDEEHRPLSPGPSPTSRRSCTGHFGTPSAGTQSSATPPMRPIRPGRRASPR